MKRGIEFILMLLLACGAVQAQKKYTISSPDGLITADITVGEQLTWSLSHNGTALIEPSPVSLTLAGGEQLGPDARVRHARRQNTNEAIPSPFWISAEVKNQYNEL